MSQPAVGEHVQQPVAREKSWRAAPRAGVVPAEARARNPRGEENQDQSFKEPLVLVNYGIETRLGGKPQEMGLGSGQECLRGLRRRLAS